MKHTKPCKYNQLGSSSTRLFPSYGPELETLASFDGYLVELSWVFSKIWQLYHIIRYIVPIWYTCTHNPPYYIYVTCIVDYP